MSAMRAEGQCIEAPFSSAVADGKQFAAPRLSPELRHRGHQSGLLDFWPHPLPRSNRLHREVAKRGLESVPCGQALRFLHCSSRPTAPVLLAPAPERPRAPPEVTQQGRATLAPEHRTPTAWPWASDATHVVSIATSPVLMSWAGLPPRTSVAIPQTCPSLHQEFRPQSPGPCPSSLCLHTSDDSKLTTTKSSLSLWNSNGNAPPQIGFCPWAAGPHCRPGFGGRVLAPQRLLDRKSCPQACHSPACRAQSLIAFHFLPVFLWA